MSPLSSEDQLALTHLSSALVSLNHYSKAGGKQTWCNSPLQQPQQAWPRAMSPKLWLSPSLHAPHLSPIPATYSISPGFLVRQQREGNEKKCCMEMETCANVARRALRKEQLRFAKPTRKLKRIVVQTHKGCVGLCTYEWGGPASRGTPLHGEVPCAYLH